MLFRVLSLLIGLSSNAFDEAPIYLTGVEGIELEEDHSGQIILKGTLYRKSDFKKVADFLALHPEVKNETKAVKAVRENRQNQIRHSKTKPHISADSSVLFEIALIEIKKSALERLGSRFPHLLGVGLNFDFKILGGGQDHVSVFNSDPIRGFLDAAIQNGSAKIHSKQSLVVQNKKWGEFRAGGELPIKIVSTHSSRIEFKDYGLILKVLPDLKQNSMIHLAIDSEVSDLDMGGLIDGMPMISKKHLKTEIVTKLDQMLTLAGVVRQSQSQYVEKIPGLGSVPVLGRIFKSEDFRKNQSEAYIFATPRRLEGPWLPTPEF